MRRLFSANIGGRLRNIQNRFEVFGAGWLIFEQFGQPNILVSVCMLALYQLRRKIS